METSVVQPRSGTRRLALVILGVVLVFVGWRVAAYFACASNCTCSQTGFNRLLCGPEKPCKESCLRLAVFFGPR